MSKLKSVSNAPSEKEVSPQSAWLALGGNVGDVAGSMRLACAHLERHYSLNVIGKSKIYSTPPWGPVAQDRFLNAVIEISTTLAPRDLLSACLATEKVFGRERAQRWGPRTLDIDLLAMESGCYKDEALELPHPRMLERAFVLVPLADLVPHVEFAGKSVKAWMNRQDCEDIVAVGEF